MKRRHFDALKPCCPVCRAGDEVGAPLLVAAVAAGTAGVIEQGVLRCTRAACQCEFPIVDGVPIIVPRVREFVSANAVQLGMRDDLTPEVEGMLGECCGPGSWLDAVRQHLSNYTWDHYAEFDGAESTGDVPPGSVSRTLALGDDQLRPIAGRPVIDIGCSVGRASFELAQRSDDLVLGVDIHIPMLRFAQRVLRDARVRYARRRVGMIYDRREFPVRFGRAANVDFWACDAAALPFAPGTFGAAVSLNVLDCVPSPLDHLRSIRSVLAPGARALLTTPYDWSGNVTPVEAWIGGHSPRGHFAGDSAAILRGLLTPGAHPASVEGLRIVHEVGHAPWHVRIHDRSTMRYDLHVAVAEAR